MSTQDEIVSRVRALIPADSSTLEKSMFGGRAFMVDGALLVSVLATGGLLVRVDPRRHDDYVDRPGAVQGEMGGRTMGCGWLMIAADEIDREGVLESWMAPALEFNSAARPH